MEYTLEKQIWTDADFDKMGWHDNPIYQLRVTGDLELDIDYILKWNEAEIEGLPFTFWIAPATLVFKGITNLTFDLITEFEGGLEIEDIERESDTQWTILTQKGNFQFEAEGYEQYIRQSPSFQFSQMIGYAERNGYSLERTAVQDKGRFHRDDIEEKRKKNFELYELAKRRALKRIEKTALIKSRESNEIQTKDFLLRKREIDDVLFSCDFYLKGTQFESW